MLAEDTLSAARRPSLAVALLVISALSAPARASEFQCPERPSEDAAAEHLARKLFDEAVAREPADPDGALERLRCAQTQAERPAIALRIGTISERLGADREAVAAFERYLALAGADAPDAEQMRAHIAGLRARLRPSTRPPPAPRPAARAPEAARSSTPEVVGWVIAGTGAALALAGGVLLLDARLKNDDVHALPAGTTHWDSDGARGKYDAAVTEQTIGIVGICVGALLAAGGAILALRTAPDVPGGATKPSGAAVGLRF